MKQIAIARCSKVDSAFHPSKVDQMSSRNSGDLVVKSKLSSWWLCDLDTLYVKRDHEDSFLKKVLILKVTDKLSTYFG